MAKVISACWPCTKTTAKKSITFVPYGDGLAQANALELAFLRKDGLAECGWVTSRALVLAADNAL
jgi:hypothetical protein